MPSKSVIVFSCDPTCRPDVHVKKVRPKKIVYLVADGTDVTLNFVKSPFDPPVTTVHIPQDTFVKKKIGSKGGVYRYSVSCSKCRSQQDDPSMVVEL